MTIGENIKRIRIQRGLTQKELGFLVGISESAIRGYELGIRVPKLNRLEKIAFSLGVNVEALKSADLNNISAMQHLFQLFRQYNGKFDAHGNLHFNRLNLRAWYKRWNIYQDELKQAEQITNKQERLYAIEDAEDKFNWWMDTYPRSDAFNVNFDETLENYRKLKKKRRKNNNT